MILFLTSFFLLKVIKLDILTAIPKKNIPINSPFLIKKDHIESELDDEELDINQNRKEIAEQAKKEKERLEKIKADEIANNEEDKTPPPPPSCDPDIMKIIMPIDKIRPYSQIIDNKNITEICPTLRDNCCDPLLLQDKVKEVAKEFEQFTSFLKIDAEIENYFKQKNIELVGSEVYQNYILTDQMSMILNKENILAAYRSHYKTYSYLIKEVMIQIAVHYTGFLCEFCSVKTPNLVKEEEKDGKKTLTLQVLSRSNEYDYGLMRNVFRLEMELSHSYKILRHLGNTTLMQMSFYSQEEYEEKIGDLAFCMAHEGIETDNKPICEAFYQSMDWEKKFGGFKIVKQFYLAKIDWIKQVIPEMNINQSLIDDMKDEYVFVKGNPLSPLKLEDLKTDWSYEVESFDMNKHYLNQTLWLTFSSIRMVLGFGGLAFLFLYK